MIKVRYLASAVGFVMTASFAINILGDFIQQTSQKYLDNSQTQLVQQNKEIFNSIEKIFGPSSAYAIDDSFNIKGIKLQKQGKYEESIELFDKSIELRPTHPPAYVNKAASLSMWAESINTSDKKKSASLYAQSNEAAVLAIKKITEHIDYHSNMNLMLGIAYETLGFNHKVQGDKKKAIEYLEKSLKFSPLNKFAAKLVKQLKKGN